EELKASIGSNGVRMPIEVFALEEPRGDKVWGLISGYRRLYALRELFEYSELARFAEVPALVRPFRSTAEAMVAVVGENALRAGLSPWERGRIAVAARDAGAYPTVEAAVEGLYAAANRTKRGRLRGLARLVEELADALHAPERLSERQALRLADAVQAGHAPMLREVLAKIDPARQWPALAEVLAEIARLEELELSGDPRTPRRGRRAAPERRKVARLKGRRELSGRGCVLTVTGPDATEALAAAIMAQIQASASKSSERRGLIQADLQRAVGDGRAGGQEGQAGGMGE